MSLYTTRREAGRSPPRLDGSAEGLQPRPTERDETEASLPRHLLVSLAGITADAASLQERCVDTPELHADLGGILDRLDGLVDSIYQRAADPVAPSVHRSGPAADPRSDALAELPADVADVGSTAPSPTRAERPSPDH